MVSVMYILACIRGCCLLDTRQRVWLRMGRSRAALLAPRILEESRLEQRALLIDTKTMLQAWCNGVIVRALRSIMPS